MFDVCTMGDTAHIDAIFKFLPHTREHGRIDILHCCDDPCLLAWITAAVKNADAPMLTHVWQKAWIIAAVKNIDAPMLMRMWQKEWIIAAVKNIDAPMLTYVWQKAWIIAAEKNISAPMLTCA
jgi:hypothetical protein